MQLRLKINILYSHHQLDKTKNKVNRFQMKIFLIVLTYTALLEKKDWYLENGYSIFLFFSWEWIIMTEIKDWCYVQDEDVIDKTIPQPLC